MQKILRFGIIGCGRIAKNHLEAINDLPQAKLVAVCDIDETALKQCTDKYNCLGYKDYKDILANPEIDIINICTPSGLHARQSIDAMERGKHVIVEKPMAMSLYEADAMIAAAKNNNVKLVVMHQNRFNKAIIKLRKAVEAGNFGKFTHGSAQIRWNRNDDYYKQSPWRGTWEHDGGCLLNQSIHNIDLLQWMLGAVESVFAYTATNIRPIQAEDTAVIALKFQNGALGTIEAATTLYPKNLEETLSIFGTTGTAVVGGIAVNKIKIWRFPNQDEAAEIAEITKEPPNVYGFGHANVIEDMINAITENRQPVIPGIEGKKALEIILAIYHSVRLKKEITLPLQEEFRIGVGL
jgi:predicted dehydrogenase